MDKKKGDKDEHGSYYKIDLKQINPITADIEIVQQCERLVQYKTSNENLINRHNHLLKVRQVAATIPDEYLSTINLDRLISIDDTRKLIIKGCEAEIKEISIELENLFRHFRRHIV
jgi:ABC-type histidine transport system ATPase subunit